MLETLRKHHYVLMCFIAAAVIIAFTFLYNPNRSGGGMGDSSQQVGMIFGRPLTLGEAQNIKQQKDIAEQLARMAMQENRMSMESSDPVMQFVQTIDHIVNLESPRDRNTMDLDYPMNVLVMRKECEDLGIEVEREDLEKFVKEVGAFKNKGSFDPARLEDFLTSGGHGDRSSTETKLFTTLRDVMLFQRLAQLIGGTFAPSKAEIDSEYARIHQQITAAVALVDKKNHENQTVTDEEVQKFYDAEKAKKEDAKPDDKTPPAQPDPLVLSEEKRTVKYLLTTASKPPEAPKAPPPVPPLGDVSKLPEDQKKAKEAEHKKKEEEYTKVHEAYTKRMEEHTQKMKEHTAARTAWLKNVDDLSQALVSEDRSGKSLEDIVKTLFPAPAPAPAPPPSPAPAPAPKESDAKPANGSPPAAIKAAEVKPDGSPPNVNPPAATKPDAEKTPEKSEPPGKGNPGEEGKPGAEGKPADASAPAAGDKAPASTGAETSKPAEAPKPAPNAKPAEAAKPIETPKPADAPRPAEAPKPAETPKPPDVSTPAEKPPVFEVKTATFTHAMPPEEIKNADPAILKAIFEAKKGGPDELIGDQGQNTYCIFQVTDIEEPSVLPFDQVKQKITDKLKTDKIDASMKAAAESARSNILEGIKGGKSFKDAATAAMLTVTELPVFSKDKPLPPATPNAAAVTAAITGEEGMGMQKSEELNAGELSQPLPVPGGLLLVYVEKKELPKHPDMEQQKKALARDRTFRNAEAPQPNFNQAGGYEKYIRDQQYFSGNFGGLTNPVFKAWFAARRRAAQAAQ